MQLIDADGKKIEDDPWQQIEHLAEALEKDSTKPSLAEYSILALSGLVDDLLDDSAKPSSPQIANSELLSQTINLGISFPGEITADELHSQISKAFKDEAFDINKIALLQANIPAVKEGRCFSLAKRLREQYNYRGDLRAYGSYLPDQIFFLKRVGFSSFMVDLGKDLTQQELDSVLKPFSEVYQNSADYTNKPTSIAQKLSVGLAKGLAKNLADGPSQLRSHNKSSAKT